MLRGIRLTYGLWVLGLLLATANVRAEEFITLDWSRLKIDSVLPTFVTSIDMGRLVEGASCQVVVEYPEWEELTADEKKAVERLGVPVPADLQVETMRSVARKQLKLAVSFCPIIKKERTYYKLVSCRVRPVVQLPEVPASPKLTRAVGRGRYTDKSVLSEGRWVKICVDKEGIYQLTPSALASMGFKDPARVRLFGYGGRVQNEVIDYDGATPDCDDLEEVPLYKDGTRWLFYAEGVVRWNGPTYNTSVKDYIYEHANNPYSLYSCYFLTEGEPMAFPEESAEATGAAVTDFPEHAVYENDAFCWYASGRKLYDSYDFASSNTKTFTVETPGLDTTRAAIVRIAFSASNTASTSVKVGIGATESVKTFTVRALSRYEQAVDAVQTFRTTSLKNPSQNTVKLTTTAGRSARLDYITVNYTRRLSLEGACLPFSHYLQGARTFELANADEKTRVWRIGRTGVPTAEQKGVLSGTTYRVPVDDATERFVALNLGASFPSPRFVENVANQNLHENVAYDMVIIVPKSGKLTAQAQRLADAHAQHDGLRVKVVRADEIYNEFSSGTPDVTAYRRYMKMLYDRAQDDADMPRYLLFFGDAAWDNRMITATWRSCHPDDFLLCYESENSVYEVESYVTDDYAGFLDDGESSRMEANGLDLGIGRFPVRTAEEARVMVDKVLAYMGNARAGAWQNTVCMLADDGDSNEHMYDAETVASSVERLYPDVMMKRFYWDAYEIVNAPTGNTYPQVSKAIKEQVNKGALIMNYSGHGAPNTISPERVLVLSDFENFSSANLPLWVTASCEITPFDKQEETIGETAVLNERGAAIAFMSASRAVYSTPNRSLNRLFMKYVLGVNERGERNTLGDALRLTKASLVAGTDGFYDSSLNKLKYALMGDPALALMFPLHRVVVDSINGKPAADGTGAAHVLPAGSAVSVAGHVETAGGERMDDFNGLITLTVRDVLERVVCRNNAATADTAFVYPDRPITIFEGNDSVVNGSYRMTFRLPLDVTYTERTGLMNFYAVSNDYTRTASGRYEDYSVTVPSAGYDNDSLGPKIYVYLNEPDFRDGGKVNETPYFVALLSDEDGINVSGNGVGHDLELIIDGKETTSYVLNNYYANDFGSYVSGSVGFSIPALSEGQHTLFFRAWDMNNNSSARSLNFVVENGLRPAMSRLTCYPNPARTTTQIQMVYNRPESEVRVRLYVFDTMGRQVWSRTLDGVSSNGSYVTTWNLVSSAGNRVSAGLYFVRACVEDAGGKSTLLTDKIVVLGQ